MPESIFRKLKDYIYTEQNIVKTSTLIFGNLMSTDCEYYYDGKTYRPSGVYSGEYDFLLDYYVVGIRPKYRLEDDEIKPYLRVVLRKDIKDLI